MTDSKLHEINQVAEELGAESVLSTLQSPLGQCPSTNDVPRKS